MNHYQLETAWVMYRIHGWTLAELAKIHRVSEQYLADSLNRLYPSNRNPK